MMIIVSEFLMRIVMGIGDWGLGANPQYPQSPIPNPRKINI